MEFRGSYDSGVTYNVGDVVKSDLAWYLLQKPASAGTAPENSQYWGRVSGTLADAAELVNDAIVGPAEDLQKVEKTRIEESAEKRSVATFVDGADGMPLKAVTVEITPTQNLNGFDKPWAGGAWKNTLPAPTKIQTTSDLTVTEKNGKLTISGTVTGNVSYITMTVPKTKIASGYIMAFMNGFTGATTYFKLGNTEVDYFALGVENRVANTSTLSPTYNRDFDTIIVQFTASKTLTEANLSIMVVPDGTSTSTFLPYANICPIPVYESVTVSRSGADASAHEDTVIPFPEAVCGCELTVYPDQEGTFKTTWRNIDSYAGETLPDEWMSDRDVYASGMTPTTGAQVAYKLAATVEYPMAPVEITSVKGLNRIWSSAGVTGAEYRADPKMYVDSVTRGNVPEYFLSNLEQAVSLYRKNEEAVGNGGQSFIFITDPHWGVSERHSPDLIRYLVSNFGIRTVICGGDILDRGEIADEMAKGYEFMKSFSGLPVMVVTGNHDYNKNGHVDDSSYWLTPNQAYSMFVAQNEANIHDVYSGEPSEGWAELNYYMDIPGTNTRILFASLPYGKVSDATSAWITDQLDDNPTINFIIVSHFLYDEGDYTSDVKTLFAAVEDFSNLKAWVFGHTHFDMVDYLAGIPLVCTDTDSSRLDATHNPNTYTPGTITEHAFDIVTVDYSDGTVECVRVGRGKHRRINGGTNAVAAAGTKALTTSIQNPVWKSSNASVATVSGGTVTGVGAGNAVITASGADKEEYWSITVS